MFQTECTLEQKKQQLNSENPTNDNIQILTKKEAYKYFESDQFLICQLGIIREASLFWLGKCHKHNLYTRLKNFLLFVFKFVENENVFLVEINIDTFSNS